MSAESLTVRRCSNCRALPARLDAETCEYCGKALPPRAERDPARATRPDDPSARFAALDAHPELPRLLQTGPPPPSHMSTVAKVILSVVFGLFVLSFLLPLVFRSPFGVVVLALFGFAVVRGIAGAAQSARLAHAPLERRKALVVDERTQVRGDRRREAESRYFATLEYPDGARQEVPVVEDAAGYVTRGDIGVAYLRAEHLVAFARVPV